MTTAKSIFIVAMIIAVPVQGQQDGLDPFNGSGVTSRRVMRNVMLDNAEIASVLRIIADATDWSIIMSPGVPKTLRISLWIKELSASEVLDKVADLAGLVLEREGRTVLVMTFDEYAKKYHVEKLVVPLKHTQAEQIASILKPFVQASKGQGEDKVVADASGNNIVLLVREPLKTSLIRLVESLDVPFAKDKVEVIQLKHLEASAIVPDLEKFLSQGTTRAGQSIFRSKGEAKATGKAAESQRAGESWLVQFMVEANLNVVVLRGLPADVDRTAKLIAELDVPTDIQVIAYPLEFTDASEVYITLVDLVAQEQFDRQTKARDRLRITASEQNNRIVIEGSPKDHARLAKMIEVIDKPLPPGTGGVRVYRLENASSSEVANVIRDMIEEPDQQTPLARRDGSVEPDYVRRAQTMGRQAESDQAPAPRAPEPEAQAVDAGDILPPRVSEAPEINAVIIRASSAEHEAFARVIEEMDMPRDQVLLEVTLMTVQSTEGFDLGVELSGARVGDVTTNVIGLSQFGIGAVNSATGTITLPTPAPLGANLAIFNASDFSLVVNALKTVGDVRITSIPKILVQDNSEAEIRQLNQEPFETTNQVENSVVTTFGGFVDAGTTLTVTPHVSKDGWLRLDYQVQLSSFGTRNAQQLDLPPPRQENSSRGTVRVPAEHMVAVGGLTGTRIDETEDIVPLLGEIPLIGEAFKKRSRDRTNETLFIFIRPVVLRDPDFQDLLFLSEEEIERARLKRDEPTNPLKMFVPWEGQG